MHVRIACVLSERYRFVNVTKLTEHLVVNTSFVNYIVRNGKKRKLLNRPIVKIGIFQTDFVRYFQRPRNKRNEYRVTVITGGGVNHFW